MAKTPDHWSIGLGRWGGVEVRLHVSLLLAFLLVFYAASRDRGSSGVFVVAIGMVGLWLFSLLVHEIVPQMARRQHGGELDLIVLGPCGGLSRDVPPAKNAGEFIAVLSGIMVSLAMFLFALAVVHWQQGVKLADLMQPESLAVFLPDGAHGIRAWQSVGPRLLLVINAWIVLTNLIPAYPFDAGWACVALLRTVRPDWDRRRCGVGLAICSRAMAVVFFVLALGLHDASPNSLLPTWLVLNFLALGMYLSARSIERSLHDLDSDDETLGYDFSQGYTSLERSRRHFPHRPGLFLRLWRTARRRWKRRQSRIVAEEDRQLDSILARLHQGGMSSLTFRERALLRRASARYKNRQSTM
ncbi:MAG TPA: hypothetical protein VIY86_07105 [Pirellulaceae bacterium]